LTPATDIRGNRKRPFKAGQCEPDFPNNVIDIVVGPITSDVEVVSPKVRTGLSCDQLHVDPQRTVNSAHAAFRCITNFEFVTNAPDVGRLSPIGIVRRWQVWRQGLHQQVEVLGRPPLPLYRLQNRE
jgi:hypothetical protein